MKQLEVKRLTQGDPLSKGQSQDSEPGSVPREPGLLTCTLHCLHHASGWRDVERGGDKKKQNHLQEGMKGKKESLTEKPREVGARRGEVRKRRVEKWRKQYRDTKKRRK